VVPVSNAFQHSKIKCTPAWDPIDGNLLAIPFGKEIKFFQRGVWRELYTVHDYRLSEQVMTKYFLFYNNVFELASIKN